MHWQTGMFYTFPVSLPISFCPTAFSPRFSVMHLFYTPQHDFVDVFSCPMSHFFHFLYGKGATSRPNHFPALLKSLKIISLTPFQHPTNLFKLLYGMDPLHNSGTKFIGNITSLQQSYTFLDRRRIKSLYPHGSSIIVPGGLHIHSHIIQQTGFQQLFQYPRIVPVGVQLHQIS